MDGEKITWWELASPDSDYAVCKSGDAPQWFQESQAEDWVQYEVEYEVDIKLNSYVEHKVRTIISSWYPWGDTTHKHKTVRQGTEDELQ